MWEPHHSEQEQVSQAVKAIRKGAHSLFITLQFVSMVVAFTMKELAPIFHLAMLLMMVKLFGQLAIGILAEVILLV